MSPKDLAAAAGIPGNYSTRWRSGQMYVDRAEQLVRLAVSLQVEVALLFALAVGKISAEAATNAIDDEPAQSRELFDEGVNYVGALAEKTATAVHLPRTTIKRRAGRDSLILLISAAPASRDALTSAVQRHGSAGGLIVHSLVLALMIAERYRPDLTFLDLDLSPTISLEACRTLSGLAASPRRRNRVIAGSTVLSETVQVSAQMAGAAIVLESPFIDSVFFGALVDLKNAPA